MNSDDIGTDGTTAVDEQLQAPASGTPAGATPEEFNAAQKRFAEGHGGSYVQDLRGGGAGTFDLQGSTEAATVSRKDPDAPQTIDPEPAGE
jgi:hypothetical protein